MRRALRYVEQAGAGLVAGYIIFMLSGVALYLPFVAANGLPFIDISYPFIHPFYIWAASTLVSLALAIHAPSPLAAVRRLLILLAPFVIINIAFTVPFLFVPGWD